MIYWYTYVHREIPESEKIKIRQKTVSDAINSTLMSISQNPANTVELQSATQRGWDQAKRSIDMMENCLTITQTWLMIDSKAKHEISKTEMNPSFKGWVNPDLIEQIKNLQF